jgi:hypothetical protein
MEILPKCEGPLQCPLGITHPPNGIEYAIGCSVCREQVTKFLFILKLVKNFF